MNVSTLKVSVPDAEDVTVTDDTLTAEFPMAEPFRCRYPGIPG